MRAAAVGIGVWLAGAALAAYPAGHLGPEGADPRRAVALAASDDGRFVASLAPDGHVAVWDVEAAALAWTLPAGAEGAFGLALSADGGAVAVQSPGALALGTAAGPLWTVPLPAAESRWSIHPPPVFAGRQVVAAVGDQVVRLGAASGRAAGPEALDGEVIALVGGREAFAVVDDALIRLGKGPIADGVRRCAADGDGGLVCTARADERQLWWVSRSGQKTPMVTPGPGVEHPEVRAVDLLVVLPSGRALPELGRVLASQGEDWGNIVPELRLPVGVGQAVAEALPSGAIALRSLADQAPAPVVICAPSAPPASGRRGGPPVDLALAVDITGSLGFGPMSCVREAAIAALDGLVAAAAKGDRVSVATGYFRWSHLRGSAKVADRGGVAALRAELGALEVAGKVGRDGVWARPQMPTEYLDEYGSDPSVGLRGAAAALGSAAPGGRAVLWIGDGPVTRLGPGQLRGDDRETRWPEIEGPPDQTREAVRASIAEVADALAASGASIWVLVLTPDEDSCDAVRGQGTCTTTDDPAALPGLAAAILRQIREVGR